MDMEKQINQLNEKDERIGYWKLVDGDFKLWSEGNYINGKKDGEWIYYNRDKTSYTKQHNHETETTVDKGKDPQSPI